MFKIDLTGSIQLLDRNDALFANALLAVRDVLFRSLTGVAEGDIANSVETRLYRVALAERVRVNQTVVLSVGDVAVLAPLISRTFAHPFVLNHFLRMVGDCVTRGQDSQNTPEVRVLEPQVPKVEPVPDASSEFGDPES